VVLALALALPLLGAWVASTLVVHYESSRELAVAVGLGLSLVFPVAWEFLSVPPRQPGGARPQRWLRLRTRLLLRTWAVNLLFMAGALLLSPQGVFTALSTRGDWMLPASGGPLVESARRLFFKAADGVEWAYVLAMDNPYREHLIAVAPAPSPRQRPHPLPSELAPAEPQAPSRPAQPSAPPSAPTGDAAKEPSLVPPPPEPDSEQAPLDESEADVIISWKTEPKPSKPEPEPEPMPAQPEEPPRREFSLRGAKPSEQPSGPRQAGGSRSYPLPAQLHPRVTSVPRSVETDLVSVARYLVDGESDPFQRIKALHDYVADRVVYDVEAYRTRTITFDSQRPEAVLQSRRAVCAGYSNLFAAMGKAVGEDVVTLSGDAYSPRSEKEFESHAWNAVRIEGEWYLVDVTWDAGHVKGDFFARGYKTTYLFMPPKEFLATHIPDEPAWQLLDEPLERGAAMRYARGPSQDTSTTPTAPPPTAPPTPQVHAWDNIRIREPSRPRAEVKGRFHVELENPKGLPAEVTLHNVHDGSQEPCHPEYGGTRYSCTALGRGLYRIQVLSGPRDMNPQLAAQLEVTAL
jgi:transglutaminase-like putative cysteine protease